MITLTKEDAFTIVDIISKAKEIVRCKDCKYWETYDGRSWCERVVGGCGEMTADDFYSRGEKNEF